MNVKVVVLGTPKSYVILGEKCGKMWTFFLYLTCSICLEYQPIWKKLHELNFFFLSCYSDTKHLNKKGQNNLSLSFHATQLLSVSNPHRIAGGG